MITGKKNEGPCNCLYEEQRWACDHCVFA
ncbi:MAG: hypothetical protein RL685_6019, partial [Pseudomonadota bacterium]